MAAVKPLHFSGGTPSEVPSTDTLSAKVQVSASDVLLGRLSASSGAHEEIEPTDLTEDTSLAGDDVLLGWNSSGALRKFKVGALPAGGGSPSVISPSQITSAWAHNWAPTGIADATTIRVDFDNSLPGITGIDATGISDGERKRIINDGQYFGMILPDNTGSTAANRFTGTGVEFLHPYGGCIEIEYDGTASRWRVLSNNFNPATYPGIIYSQISPGSATAGDNADAAFTVSGTGAAVTGTNASFGFPGNRRLATGSTSTGAATLSAFKGVVSYAAARYSHIIAAGMINLPALSDGTNRYTVEVGMNSAPTGTSAIATGCFLRYSDNINSGKWQLVSANVGSESSADSGVTVAESTSYRYLISLDSGGYEANFFLNGVFVGKVTTNTPGSGEAIGHRVTIRKSVGTSSSTLDLANMISYAIYTGQ